MTSLVQPAHAAALAAVLVAAAVGLSAPVGAAESVTFNSADAPPTSFAIRKAKERGVELKIKPGHPLTGRLSRPTGAGPHPAVVILHGCAGPEPYTGAWAKALAGWGYVALEMDSFGPRGVKEICTGFDRMDTGQLVYDLYGALAFLGDLTFIDPDRIGIMGWGFGGRQVLSAVNIVGVQSLFNERFRAAVVIYPRCMRFVGPFVAPVLILAGGRDDWTPAALCEAMVKAARRGPHPLVLKVYPGAHHGFDNPKFPKPQYLLDVENRSKTPARGATVGYDRAAHEDALARVKTFLAMHLK